MGDTITYRTVSGAEEARVRLWLLEYDDEMGLHSQLKNYFLSGSPTAGIAVGIGIDGSYKCMCLYSCYENSLHVHTWLGEDVSHLDKLIQQVGAFSGVVTVTAFLKLGVIPDSRWVKQFDVTPGFVIDHRAYSGVFSRSAPRFNGAVYEKHL